MAIVRIPEQGRTLKTKEAITDYLKGINIEYQTYNLGGASSFVVPQDHRFNLSFTLAGIGTFSNFFGAFGGQTGR